MPGPYRERARLILAKIETTPGVDAAPSATTDAVRSVGLPLAKIGYIETGLRDDVQSGHLWANPRAQPAGRFATFDITMEVAGSVTGAAYNSTVNKPEVDVFLRMAGMARFVTTTAGSENIMYVTLDSGMETATCWVYQAGKLIKMVGCVATLRLAGDAAKRGLFTFSVTGQVLADPTEAALPALSGLPTLAPPLFHSGAANIGAWTSSTSGDPLVLKHVDVDFQNTVVARDSAGATDGLIGYLISDRRARQTMDVEVAGLSTFDAFAMSKAAVGALPLTNYQFGTAQYQRMRVQTGVWALEAPDPASANSINTMRLTGNLTPGAPTNGGEIQFIFD